MIILLEGLPGAGKSIQSGIIHRTLEQNGITSTWVHELYRPHPVLFFHEASLTRKPTKNGANNTMPKES